MTLAELRAWPGSIYRFIWDRAQGPFYLFQRHLQSRLHGRELTLVQDNTAAIRPGDVLLFATLRNEAIRMPYFLEYYRRLGVRHFLLVDNQSDDDFAELVADMPDVSVWYTESSYRDANFGMHWLNALLRRYGCGHWCVTCDPDEFLVFPYQGDRQLPELAGHLEGLGRRSLCCVMLDMYGEQPVSGTQYERGADPFAVAPFFDGTGYVQDHGWLREIKVMGGVRRRFFFSETPQLSPSIHKTPFVKWRYSYSYFLSMHQLVPEWLNIPHGKVANAPTGCLMHFKYFSLVQEKVAEELVRKQHWDDSFEYRQYHSKLDSLEKSLVYEKSVRFRDWRQLVELGFMNRGQWF